MGSVGLVEMLIAAAIVAGLVYLLMKSYTKPAESPSVAEVQSELASQGLNYQSGQPLSAIEAAKRKAQQGTSHAKELESEVNQIE